MTTDSSKIFIALLVAQPVIGASVDRKIPALDNGQEYILNSPNVGAHSL